MTTRALILLPIVAFAGCASGASADMSSSGGSGGTMGGGGSSGPAFKLDASPIVSSDASASADAGGSTRPTLMTDAPTFNWDTHTCVGCADTGGAGGTAGEGGNAGSAGGGGRSGSGGSPGSGGMKGSGGSSSSGGRSGSGGMSAAGGSSSSGSGGRSGSGGAVGTGGRGGSSGALGGSSGSTGKGGSTAVGGAAGGTGGSGSGGSPAVDGGVGILDALPPPRDGAVEAPRGADAGADAWTAPCVAKIRTLVPATDNLAAYGLVAGSNTQIVLRVEVQAGGPVSPVWTWQGIRDRSELLPPVYGVVDPSSVAFPVISKGQYTFTVNDQSMQCVASVQATAIEPNACPDCDRAVILRAAPPASADLPVQSGAIGLVGSSPFSQNNVVLAQGVPVQISPSVGGTKVASYVRIGNPVGDLVVDGLADPKSAFGARLLAMNTSMALLRYNVLVVPIDGIGGGTIAATAPQLYQSMTPDQINGANFGLSGGVSVTGVLSSSDGLPLLDARVILSNRNPNDPVQPSDLIFSSVGRADAQGGYLLHAQRGQYWVSVSPPYGKGLAEALAPSAVTLSGDTILSFQWVASSMTSLTLQVVDANNMPLDGARVRLTSAQATEVGVLSVSTAGQTYSQGANGNVRVEGTTSGGGFVTFASLPVGATYDALIVPPTLGPSAATTVRKVVASAGGGAQVLQLLPQGLIRGRLVSGVAGGSDWSRVHLVAYDRSLDTPEPPQIVSVSLDGSYAIGASPGRAYVAQVVPDQGTGLARTFVGSGPLQASEFIHTQKVLGAMPWIATVMSENQLGLDGTALQVFCEATWPNCMDSTVPLAETTSQDGGLFQLSLPDPSTR